MPIANAVTPRSEGSITSLLVAWSEGDDAALAQLTPVVLTELRRLARVYLRKERDGHTLQTDALVNEAYVRLLDLSNVQWRDRAHFFALSARLMRRILVDHARSRQYQKRGGGARRLTLDDAGDLPVWRAPDLVALDDALSTLAKIDERKAQVVELRFFGGFTVDDIAAALSVSPPTVMRDWRVAKMWLLRELSSESAS